MKRNSELNVTVNTTNSAARLRTFTAALKRAEQQGQSLIDTLAKMGKADGANNLVTTYARVNTGLRTNAQYLDQSTRATNTNTTATTKAKIAQEQLSAAAARAAASQTRASQVANTAANASLMGQQRLITVTAQAATAQTRASAAVAKANNDSAIAQERLSRAASQAAAASTRANAVAAKAANDALIGQQRLTSATAAAAAAQARAESAATNAGAAATRAANGARLAQERLNAATAQAAASQSRAASAAANALAAQTRASSLAARAATDLQINQDRAALSAVRLAAAEARAAADLARLGNAGARANGQMRGFMGTINTLQGYLQGGLLAFSGISFLRTADEMQALNSQIRLVTASEEEFLGVREHVRRVSDKNYNDVAATTNLYQKSARALADLGKSQSDAIKFTDAVSLAMRTGGRSALEQASAIYQLSQSMGAGVLNGDEFRTITETAPLLLELVAKRMGVLQGDLKELGAEGKITSAIIFDAMVDNADLLEQMAAKMPITMSQSLMVFKNQYKTFTDEIMNKQGGLSSIIAGSLMNMADNFDTVSKVAVAGLGLAFLQVASMINVSTLAMKAFNLVVRANPLVLLASSVLMVATAFYGVEDVLGTAGIMFGDFFDFTMMGLEGLASLARAVSYDIMEAMSGGAEGSSDAWDGFYDHTEEGFAGFAQGTARTVAAATSTLAAFFQSIGAGMVNMSKSIANIFIGISNKIDSVMSDIINEIIGNVNAAIGFIDRMASRANTALDFFNSPLKFSMIGQIEYKSQAGRPTPLLPIEKKTLGERTGENLAVLMPQIDNYFGQVARQQKAAIATKAPYILNEDPMSQEKLEKYTAREEQKRLAQEKLDAQIAANERRRQLSEERRAARERGESVSTAVELVRKAVLGGRDWGISKGGGFGGARGHNGLDIPTPVGTQVYAPEGGTVSTYGSNSSRGGKQLVLIGESGKKYGFAHLDSFDVADGTQVPAGMGIAKSGDSGKRPNGKGYAAHLHLTVTDQNGKKIDPRNATVGKSKYDATIGKYNTSVAAAAQAAAEEAAKEQARRMQAQLQLVKEYGSQEAKLAIEHRERLTEIANSGYGADEQERLSKLSEERRVKELAKYQIDLDKKVQALGAHLRNERDMIEQSRTDAQNALTFDDELSRPENSKLLEQARELVDSKYRYDLRVYEETLAMQKRDLYAFRYDERQILINGWNDKIADAMRATDELKDARVEALKEEAELAVSTFDVTQEQKMLEIRKGHMSEIAYIQEKYRLEQQLNSLSSESPAYKAANAEAIRTTASDAAKESQNRVRGAYGDQTNVLFGRNTEEQEATSKWKADHEVAAEAFEEGIIGLQEYHDRMLALDQDYVDKKQAIIVGGYETAFSIAGSLMKGFGLENSKAYKVLFAIEKGYALSKAWLNSKTAIMDAYANAAGGIGAKVLAAGKAAVETGLMTAAISALDFKGYEQGGYTGNGGTKEIAGVVHGKEYVFDAPATKRIGVDNLEKIRAGQPLDSGATPINVNISVVVDGNGGSTITGGDEKMGTKLANAVRVAVLDVMRKEKLQGGMLYGT